jgi:indoleamine 2,3-dioxygenase
MSPRELPLLSSEVVCGGDDIEQLLEEYSISSNGFLPGEPPLEVLSDPYYAPWESLIRHLATCLSQQKLRAEVDKLPVLSVVHLKTVPEYRRAYLILGFLTHAYIWGGDHRTEVFSWVFSGSISETCKC